MLPYIALSVVTVSHPLKSFVLIRPSMASTAFEIAPSIPTLFWSCTPEIQFPSLARFPCHNFRITALWAWPSLFPSLSWAIHRIFHAAPLPYLNGRRHVNCPGPSLSNSSELPPGFPRLCLYRKALYVPLPNLGEDVWKSCTVNGSANFPALIAFMIASYTL